MKALIYRKYGSPDVLELKEAEKPTTKDNEVLVKIHATAINDWDWSMVRGKPYVYRLFLGVLRPKRQIPGMELSGTIESLGKNVSSFDVGDAVYGDIAYFADTMPRVSEQTVPLSMELI